MTFVFFIYKLRTCISKNVLFYQRKKILKINFDLFQTYVRTERQKIKFLIFFTFTYKHFGLDDWIWGAKGDAGVPLNYRLS